MTTTRAGTELRAFWRMHRNMAHGVALDEADALDDDIAEVEREARADALAELRRAVEGLRDDDRAATGEPDQEEDSGWTYDISSMSFTFKKVRDSWTDGGARVQWVRETAVIQAIDKAAERTEP